MPIDFSSLVLGPCMATFGEPITVDPRASQPGVAPYQARGVYEEKPVDVELIDNNIMSSASKQLGVRLSEFTVPVAQGDYVTFRGALFLIEDTDDDGQGGTVLTLKEIRE